MTKLKTNGLFFDMDGKPMTTQQWAKLYEDFNARCLADDQVETCRIVTVWGGIDEEAPLQPDPSHVPMIFHSAVFLRPDPERPHIAGAIREMHAPTQAAAISNHDQLTAWVRVTRKAPVRA